MDFYEELGISKTASLDQVRQAYRQLARLIHPDQQTDAALRQLAEIQMKRLNAMLAVLSNPAQRGEYDRSLTGLPGPAPAFLPTWIRRVDLSRAVEWARGRGRSLWIWAAAVLLGSAVLALLAVIYGRSTEPAVSTLRQTQPPSPAGAVAVQPQRKPPRTTHLFNGPPAPPSSAPKKRGVPVSPKLYVHRSGTPSLRPPAEFILPVEPKLPSVAIPGAMPVLSNPAAAPTFSGQWLYPLSSAALPKRKGLYLPEFIEMKISEDRDHLHGDYKSRYLVTDRAISPAVVFHFDGSATVPVSTLRWDGPGGAYGRVTLRLVSIDSLEVSWTANRLSEDLQLINGTATLVRKP